MDTRYGQDYDWVHRKLEILKTEYQFFTCIYLPFDMETGHGYDMDMETGHRYVTDMTRTLIRDMTNKFLKNRIRGYKDTIINIYYIIIYR